MTSGSFDREIYAKYFDTIKKKKSKKASSIKGKRGVKAARVSRQKLKESQPRENLTTPLQQFQPVVTKSTKPEVKREFFEQTDLPTQYAMTYLTLIARDPFWIHAFWEIAPSDLEQLRANLKEASEGAVLVLRMYDVSMIDFNGANANHCFDIEISPEVKRWYISLWSDHMSYCGEIGLRTNDGRFFALTRSNFVTTPRAVFSGREDVMWMEVNENVSESPYVFAESKIIGANGINEKRKRKIFLTEEDIRAYYARLFPLLNIVKKRLKNKSNIGLEGKFFTWIKDEYTGEKYKKIFLGASEEMIVKEGGGASEQFLKNEKGGASEQVAKEKPFYFELATELIVYGRTEPNASVYWGTKKIDLREDGTFSLRVALPEGNVPLDFIAISSDQSKQKTIVTAVERLETKQSDPSQAQPTNITQLS